MSEQPPPSPRRITVIDVARAAGVSPGTVSNAISGKRKVDSETRKRIEAAIGDLGYVPNLDARRMRTGRTNTIAVFSSMPTAVAAGASKLGFLMEIAASAAITALEFNTSLVLIPPIEQPFKTLQSISIDGALVLEPEEEDPFLNLLNDRSVPTIVIGNQPNGTNPFVEFDYHSMAEQLMSHLFEAGSSNFPLIVGKGLRQANIVFKKVYFEMAETRGMLPQMIEVSEIAAEREAKAAIIRAFQNDRTIDGVLVPIDAMATGTMQGLRELGISVPRDVRVATRYDGLRARAEQPSLTALNLHLDEVSAIATRNLLDLINGKPIASPIEVPKPTLVVRASSGTIETA